MHNTPSFPRPAWRLLRKQSTLSDLKPLLTNNIIHTYDLSEKAHRVLEGPIWSFTTIVDFLCATLKERGEPMTLGELRTAAFREHYDLTAFERGMKVLDMLANVGRVWNKDDRTVRFIWHERRPGDDLNQKALDEWYD